MKRGTVVLTVFPFTDLQSSKRRPAVVVSAVESPRGDVIVAFISSVLPDFPMGTDYVIEKNHEDFERSGLLKASVIKADKLATLNKKIFTGILGEFSDGTMQAFDDCLKKALALS
jgi:mRNA interferase MazF